MENLLARVRDFKLTEEVRYAYSFARSEFLRLRDAMTTERFARVDELNDCIRDAKLLIEDVGMTSAEWRGALTLNKEDCQDLAVSAGFT